MNHIFYQTKTYYSNTGDALINNALINELRKYGALYANCGADVPEDFIASLGILPEEKIVTKSEMAFITKIIKMALQCKKAGDKVFLFSGPGDLYGGGFRLVIRNLASGMIFPLFRILGVTIVRIGRSVGPISKMMAASEWLRGQFLSHYFVRDTKSLERCHGMGIKKTKYSPDLSWIYQSEHVRKVNQTNAVMVNLRNSIFDDVEQEFVEATLHSCEEMLTKMQSVMCGRMKIYVAYQIEEDQRFSKLVYEKLKTKFDTYYIDHRMTLGELERYYSSVDYHISNRMHSLLAGYKYGSLPVSLIDTNKHMKIAATFADCNFGDLLFDIYFPIDEKRLKDVMHRRETLLHKLFECEKAKSNEITNTLICVFGKDQL